jgi:hypothetical protein
MESFANDLATFLRRHYPQVIADDGWYRFSADLCLKNGRVDLHIPLLTRLPDPASGPAATVKWPVRRGPRTAA